MPISKRDNEVLTVFTDFITTSQAKDMLTEQQANQSLAKLSDWAEQSQTKNPQKSVQDLYVVILELSVNLMLNGYPEVAKKINAVGLQALEDTKLTFSNLFRSLVHK
jgi:hypothetical protein